MLIQHLEIAVNHLKKYNATANDPRFTAMIDIIEQIFRETAEEMLKNTARAMTDLQKEMMKAAFNNLNVDHIDFENGPSFKRSDFNEESK